MQGKDGKGAMSYWDHIVACNQMNTDQYDRFDLYTGTPLGWIHKDRLALLSAYGDVFEFQDIRVVLKPQEDLTRTMQQVCHDLQERGAIQNWREERYAVKESFLAPPLFELERAATPFFGISGFGIHVNGYVRKPDGIYMWIARRAADRYICPDKLDNLVAGGQPVGLTLRENLQKECAEEAAIAPSLVAQAQSVGSIRYCMETPDGVKPDVIFCYDLELPSDFIPQNTDGEVASFELLPLDAVAEIVRTSDAFKFNCNLVIIDFLIRHGVINPDQEPTYEALTRGLQGQLL